MTDQIQRLDEIVKRLRAPDGCPWDKEQTFQSLTPHIIEEAYELVTAMESGNKSDLQEELGDVLLHVVMLSSMAEEEKAFTLNEVARDVSDKMIRRHPHVFGDGEAKTVDDVWKNWDAIKKQEKQNQGPFESIPKQLPALLQAYKLQKKAARLGFDFPTEEGALEKVQEETQELLYELRENPADLAKCEAEFGDLLFSLINIARKLGLNPEEALRHTNEKFRYRFTKMDDMAQNKGAALTDLSLEELDSLWTQSKNV